jgi:hypothetical protein
VGRVLCGGWEVARLGEGRKVERREAWKEAKERE